MNWRAALTIAFYFLAACLGLFVIFGGLVLLTGESP